MKRMVLQGRKWRPGLASAVIERRRSIIERGRRRRVCVDDAIDGDRERENF